jgi:hypothetical protein
MQIRSVGIDLGKTTFHLGSFVVQVESVFQSTPSRGGRPALKYQEPQPGCFNPRPRAGGDFITARTRSFRTCFNPRPRAGGDSYRSPMSDRSLTVSIHAPARGATPLARSIGPSAGRFNPRPRAGGDDCNADIYRGPSRFNPRPRARGDFR